MGKSEEMKQYVNASAWAVLHVATEDLERYENARLEIQSDVEALKEIFRNVQPETPGRTKKEAEQAFVEWNKEYEANRETMKEELDQWNKAENARLDKDTEAKERMQEILAMTKQHGG